jgi:mycothiol synthase
MTTTKPPVTGVTSADVPVGATPTSVPGLFLRPVRWPEEAATLNDIANAGRLAAGNLEVLSVEGILNSYAHLVHSDLVADLRLAEFEGRAVAYVRVEWRDEVRGGRNHVQVLCTRPDAPAGALEAILDWGEARSREVAATLAPNPPTTIGAYLNMETPERCAAVEARGYRGVRFFFGMVRPTLDDIPDLPLPPGVEVRPVEPEQVRAIFDAEVAAFAGHWGAGTDDGSEDHWLGFRDARPGPRGRGG